MKIVVASDSYKGSLSAKQVGEHIKKGILQYDPNIEVVNIPMADGGEGTVQSLIDTLGGSIVSVKVHDPLMRMIDGFYGILDDKDTAVIEIAAASGLPLLKKEERNPFVTSTYGTGELIKDALNKGCTKFIIGLGGSATNDGGTGMLRALGVRFLNDKGDELEEGGGALKDLSTIDISNFDSRIKKVHIRVACDVENFLCGKAGASYVFGPQKGADEQIVKQLDQALMHYAEVVNKETGIEVNQVKGAGAAGGLGGALVGFLGAKLERGIDIVLDITRFEKYIQDADLIITGEGQIDDQTRFGKTPFGVAQIAKRHTLPVVALAGSVGKDVSKLYEYGFDCILSIVDKPMSLEKAVANSGRLVEEAANRIIRLYTLQNK